MAHIILQREQEKEHLISTAGAQGPAGPTGPIGPQGLPGPSSQDIPYKAAIALGGQRVVRLSASGLVYADPTDAEAFGRVAGITLNAVSAEAYVNVKQSGEIEESTWNWNTSLPIYLGLNGTLVQIPPAGNFVQIIGMPTTSTTILVTIREPIITL